MDSNDITRRRVISTLGAVGTIGLAGCGGDGGDGGSDGGDGGTDGGDGGSDGTDGGTDGGDGGSDGGDGGSDGGDGGETTRPDTEVRIGMVQPRSGALGPYGTIALRGFLTYFGYEGADIPSEIGTGEYTLELGDTTYTMEVRDSGGAAGEAQTQAREMAQSADIIAGGTSSASANAIANNVAKRANIPYMAGPAASVALTGSSDNCGETVYRASETVAMDAQSGGKYIANETDIESVYIYYADYSFGQSVFQNYSRVLEANGVSVSGSQALPQGYSDDWPGQFENATQAGVDAVIGGFTVATLPAMLGTYLANDYDFRFVGGWGTRLSGGALGAALQNNLDELTAESIQNAGLGPLTTRYHWNQYDNEMNTQANETHRDAYGTNTDLFTSGMFTAASAIDQAVTESGSSNGDDIREALKGMTVQTTMKGEGGYQFQEWNNQARSAMTVADPIPTEDTQYWDAPIQPGAPIQTYGMDETTQPQDQQSCDLS